MKKALLTALVVVSMAAVSARAGLVGFYTFDSSNFKDSSGQGHDGTPSGSSPTFVTGYEGKAASFNPANNQYFTVPINIQQSVMPQVTFGGWFYITAGTPPIRGLISHDDGNFDRTLDIDTRSLGGISVFTGSAGGGVLASHLLPMNTWTFVAVRYDQSTATVKLDVGTSSFTRATAFGSSVETRTTVGRNPHFDSPFGGQMDNIFFYDSVLSDSQIEAIRLGGAGAIVPEPSTWLAGLSALGMLGVFAWRRQK